MCKFLELCDQNLWRNDLSPSYSGHSALEPMVFQWSIDGMVTTHHHGLFRCVKERD